MKTIDIDKMTLIKKLFMVFLILTPIFDTVFFFSRITTLVRIIIIGLFLILVLIYNRESRKYLKYLLIYYGIVLGYLIVNYWHSGSFHSLVPGDFNYSVISEGLTVLKLCMPITILYVLKYLNLTKDDYFRIVNLWVLLFAGSIVILNITKLSLSSYDTVPIQYNIFEWNEGISYKLTASKGYFVYSNQVAVTMIMLLILSVYEFLYRNRRVFINIILLSIAMIMLGTRVSSAGGIITLICLLMAYVILAVINKERLKWEACLLLIPIFMWLLLIPISPFANRNVELSLADQEVSSDNDNVAAIEPVQLSDNKVQYVYDNYNENYLPEMFFEEYYPIEYDTDFWYNFVKSYSIKDINYRFIEINIIERVVSINNDNFDKLFGISNTRIQNIMNVERDFLLHYYAFGIVGSIVLLVIYVALPVYAGLRFFKEKTYFSFALLASILLFIVSAFLTGNILNSMATIIMFAFISGGLFLDDRVSLNLKE